MREDLIERLRAYITQREKIRDGGITITECNGVPLTLTDLSESAPALESNAPVGVEDKARAMFEAQADKLTAPWDRQWEPTKGFWRKRAAEALAQQPAAMDEAIRRDAERYRWLRVKCGLVPSAFGIGQVAMTLAGSTDEHDAKRLDAHIDAAMNGANT